MVTRSEANEKLSHTIRLLFVDPLSTEFVAGEFHSFFLTLGSLLPRIGQKTNDMVRCANWVI